MAEVFHEISDELRAFIGEQRLFFVASAPLSATGHINLSPKGLDCFRVLGPNRVAYLDMTGSGNETSAHITENGRITFMFCAFSGPPNIVRLYGRARSVLPGTPDWEALVPHFSALPGARQIIAADIHRVSTSCGFAVPRYQFVDDRDQLTRWVAKKGAAGLARYRHEKNACSIDALPAPLADLTGEE